MSLPLLFVIMWIVLNQSLRIFCEIEFLLSLIYLPHVIITSNNNIGNEVLSKPILKDLLKEFGWESVTNQVNG